MINSKGFVFLAVFLFALPAVGQELININTADTQTLASIEGLSASQATSIVRNREKYGPYRDVYDLLRVPGVLMKTIASLKNRATFVGAPAQPQRVSAQSPHPLGRTNTKIVAR